MEFGRLLICEALGRRDSIEEYGDYVLRLYIGYEAALTVINDGINSI